jgi:RNA polymerase II elongation factor ELL
MTTGLDIPETGLSLRPGEQSGDPASKPVQIMRLNLVQGTLDELIQSLRSDQPARLRLGKHPSLHYDGKSHPFRSYPETHRSEIYHTSSDKRNLYFTGVLSHSLEVEKAKAATAATDQALANLEESLNAFERGKESKKTHMIQHPDELKALRAAGGGSGQRGPRSKAELEKDRLLRTAASRSLTSSPTLGSARSPALIPTSTPASQSKNNTRLEALKTPFIHLLAVRAVSSKFLARQTRSTVEDCTALAQKYGSENRLNREKFDLKDKTYKDLDVWTFPYPTQDDRQEAIENAVSAFDRMRISRTDKLWQMLLPKGERGKGKCLSRLNLSNGPVKKPAAARAQLDGGDDTGKDDDTTSNETDRRTAPSKTSDAPRSTPTQKSQAGKGPTKGPGKVKSSNNTTLTGRVTKKTAAKPPAKTDTKFKSSEYVHDSDDDEDDMPDTAPSPPAPSQRPKEEKTAPPKKAQAPAKPRATNNAPTPASKSTKTESLTPKLESSQSRSTASASSKRPAPRISTSPQKPSPLGSSPPANASDATGRSRSDSQNQSSSSSSSPLISQLSRSNKATTAAAARPPKPAAATNGPTKSGIAGNPLKRKAESDRLVPHAATGRTTGNLDHKRRRAISTSSGGSTGSASPPLSQEILWQQLREKSRTFKQYYAKYSSLHRTLKAQSNPSSADLEKLQRQHTRLEHMKEEIWDEHARLNDGISRDF